MAEGKLRKEIFQDYVFPYVKCVYISIKYNPVQTTREKVEVEKLYNDISSGKQVFPELNPLKYTNEKSLVNQIKPLLLYSYLKNSTLLFSSHCVNNTDVSRYGVLVGISNYELLKNSDMFCDLTLKFRINDLVSMTSCQLPVVEGEGIIYGCRISSQTKVVLCDRLDDHSDCHTLEYCTSYDNMHLKLIQYRLDFDEQFARFQLKQNSSFTLLQTVFQQFLHQSRSSLTSKKEEINTAKVFINQPILISAPLDSGCREVVLSFARRSSLPLISISSLDLFKRNISSELSIRQCFQYVLSLALAQEYCVFLLEDLFSFTSSSSSSSKQKQSSQTKTPEDQEYSYQSNYHTENEINLNQIFFTILLEVLQEYSQKNSAAAPSANSGSSLSQRILFIGMTDNEEKMDKRLLALFPVKLVFQENDLLLSKEQQKEYLCELSSEKGTDESMLKKENYEWNSSSRQPVGTITVFTLLKLFHSLSQSAERSLQVLGFSLKTNKNNNDSEELISCTNRIISPFQTKYYGFDKILEKLEEILIWPVKYHSYYQDMKFLSSSSSQGHILFYGPSGKVLSVVFFYFIFEIKTISPLFVLFRMREESFTFFLIQSFPLFPVDFRSFHDYSVFDRRIGKANSIFIPASQEESTVFHYY
jgi:GTP-sensing pleiotropic transcriptional regulator CodY